MGELVLLRCLAPSSWPPPPAGFKVLVNKPSIGRLPGKLSRWLFPILDDTWGRADGRLTGGKKSLSNSTCCWRSDAKSLGVVLVMGIRKWSLSRSGRDFCERGLSTSNLPGSLARFRVVCTWNGRGRKAPAASLIAVRLSDPMTNPAAGGAGMASADSVALSTHGLGLKIGWTPV